MQKVYLDGDNGPRGYVLSYILRLKSRNNWPAVTYGRGTQPLAGGVNRHGEFKYRPNNTNQVRFLTNISVFASNNRERDGSRTIRPFPALYMLA